jgi:hypothetical protein
MEYFIVGLRYTSSAKFGSNWLIHVAKQKCPRPPYLIIGPNFLVDEIPPKILGLVQIICKMDYFIVGLRYTSSAKFGSNWLSSFRGDDKNVKC